MTAIHIEDYNLVCLNGLPNEDTVTMLINNAPGEGGAISGTFRLASVQDLRGNWFLACLMDCACEKEDGAAFL